MSKKRIEWQELTLAKPEEITREHLVKMFQGEVAGIRIPNLLSVEQCEQVVAKLRSGTSSRGRRYRGDLNIGTVLNIPSHWEFAYVLNSEAAWQDYFRKVPAMTRLRRKLFAGIGDPVDRLVNRFGKAWGAGVHRARHPQFGKQLYLGLIRSGAPKLHFDWAPFDLPGGSEVVMQAGANVYLSNFPQGGDLKMYRTLGMNKGHSIASGEKVIGNYDLPHSLVEDVQSHTIRCGVGDFVIAPNRFLHEVTPGNAPQEDRLTLSFHVAWVGNGTLALFS